MNQPSITRILGGLAVTGAASLAAYLFVIRPRHLRWGATDEEIKRAMPLDNQVGKPTYVTNRAITINAQPEEIWPWLAQMGELPRGGFYSYEWIERLMGLEVENAERILPEFQQLQVGQALDRAGNMLVKDFEPNRYLVLGPPGEANAKTDFFDSTWALGLYPIDENSTRLVSRVRAYMRNTPKGWFWLALLDPGQCVMERKMLLGLKQRAEGYSRAARQAVNAQLNQRTAASSN